MRSYTATFLIFSDYMKPPIRLAALMELPVIFVFTHDSIGLGEDGPTHQPVEQLAQLRGIPGMRVLRPCDANETVEAWKVALKQTNRPTALVLSRQPLPTLDRSKYAPRLGAHARRICARGLRAGTAAGHSDGDRQRSLAVPAGPRTPARRRHRRPRRLHARGQDLFEEQDQAYRDGVAATGR